MKVCNIIKIFIPVGFLLPLNLGINCSPKVSNIINIFHHTTYNATSNTVSNVKHNGVLAKPAKENKVQDQDSLLVDSFINDNLELGNLVFYFDSKPVINFVPDRENNSGAFEKKVFIFPYAQIKDEKLIKKTNNTPGKGYKLQLERVNAPVKGIKVTLLYDLNNVTFDYKFFDSISSHKGVVFNFYNKNLIDKLKNLDDKILKTVCGKNCSNICKKKIVVVDCGHGGLDDGAIGQFGLVEKEVTLSIGMQVRDILKKKGFEVFLTRDCDKDLDLDSRTSFANNYLHNYLNNCEGAGVSFCAGTLQSILLSIHANSCTNNVSSGLETFFVENALYSDPVFFYDFSYSKIINDWINKKNTESLSLASSLQNNVYNKIKKNYIDYKDRGIKRSVSQLLLGSHMPAALIEVGFLSNSKDAEFIKSKENQELFATGICNGIVEYFSKKV